MGKHTVDPPCTRVSEIFGGGSFPPTFSCAVTFLVFWPEAPYPLLATLFSAPDSVRGCDLNQFSTLNNMASFYFWHFALSFMGDWEQLWWGCR